MTREEFKRLVVKVVHRFGIDCLGVVSALKLPRNGRLEARKDISMAVLFVC